MCPYLNCSRIQQCNISAGIHCIAQLFIELYLYNYYLKLPDFYIVTGECGVDAFTGFVLHFC